MRSGIVLLISVLLVSGCASRRMTREVEEMMSARIVVPDDVFVIKDKNVLQYDDDGDKATLVMFHDSTVCNPCHVGHMYDYLHFYEYADSTGLFDIMMIFSPREAEYDEVMSEAVILDYPYPLYVDYGGSFRRENACIPDDDRLHCFLMDKDNRPVFIGNPLLSHELWVLFENALEKITSEK